MLREKNGFWICLRHMWAGFNGGCERGIIGLLLGIFISEHKKAAGPVLTIANIGYTIPAISLLGMLIPVWGSEIRRR